MDEKMSQHSNSTRVLADNPLGAVQRSGVPVLYCPVLKELMLIDLFTKPLPTERFTRIEDYGLF